MTPPTHVSDLCARTLQVWRFLLSTQILLLVVVVDTFRTTISHHPNVGQHRPTNGARLGWRCASRQSSTSSSSAYHFLEPTISDLQKRIAKAPSRLETNQDPEQFAERSVDVFELGRAGHVIGGPTEEARLARELASKGVVIVRARSPSEVASLTMLSAAAEQLLGEAHSVEEKMSAFGPMKNYDQGVVTGYAGGGDYGEDQFLETRGRPPHDLVPDIGPNFETLVVAGRRALSRISCAVLRIVTRQRIPEIDPDAFLGLVDPGEGGSGVVGTGGLSSSPLRMCRYAGKDGVAFGAHTDTTFLTAIPCARTPGLEVFQATAGKWLRPEAASSCRPSSDVMLLAGELLEVLGRGRYHAAVHRVVRPVGSPDPRVSTPLLLRGAANSTFDKSMVPIARRKGAAYGAEKTAFEKGERGGTKQQEPPLKMADLWAALQFRGGASEGEDDCLADESADESSLLAQGLGVGEDAAVGKFERFAPGGVTVLSQDPLLVRMRGFASSSECAEIMSKAAGGLAESTTWGGADAQDESSGKRRSSTTWVVDCALPILGILTARVSDISGLPSTFMEKWQIARYPPQGYFTLHTDHVEAFNGLSCGGRLGTFILYLNDDFKGGQTEFPELGISVQPALGDAIYFHNVEMPVRRVDAENMSTDERTAHAGLSVKGGDKWIATKWIHPLPYPNGKEGPETREQAGWRVSGSSEAE